MSSGLFFPPFRSLFSTDMASVTTTHAEEPWLREAGWWQLLTVWKRNAIINSGCLRFRCTWLSFWLPFCVLENIFYIEKDRSFLFFQYARLHDLWQCFDLNVAHSCHNIMVLIHCFWMSTLMKTSGSFTYNCTKEIFFFFYWMAEQVSRQRNQSINNSFNSMFWSFLFTSVYCNKNHLRLHWPSRLTHINIIDYNKSHVCLCFRPLDYRVVLGEHDLSIASGSEQIIGVSQVHIHPQWKKLADGWGTHLFIYS